MTLRDLEATPNPELKRDKVQYLAFYVYESTFSAVRKGFLRFFFLLSPILVILWPFVTKRIE